MNITINSQILAQELRFLNKIAAAKSTIPVLSNVLLRAAGDQLRLSATDLEIGMINTCPATVHEPGQTTFPAKPLLDIIDRLPDGDVRIDDDRITSGSFRSRLASLPASDFPPLPEAPGDMIDVSAQSLHRIIERTAYAISDKEQKYVLKGALLSFSGDVMAMVATDGKCLSIATASRDAGQDVAVIVPEKTLSVLTDQTPTGVVKFSRSDRHLFFNYGRRMLISRMLDGEFPKYQRIIPKNNEHALLVDRNTFTSAIRRVGLVSEAMLLRVAPGTLELSSRSAAIGDADEALEVRYDGPEINVAVNWKLILNFLEHAAEQTITIAVKNGNTPLLLTDGADFINVIMIIKS